MRHDKLLCSFVHKSSKEFWKEANSRRNEQFTGDIVIGSCDDMITIVELFKNIFSSKYI